MADIRINALPTTASASSSDDYIALDGTTNGTRKLNAYSPTFGGNLTVSGGTITGGSAVTALAASGSAGHRVDVFAGAANQASNVTFYNSGSAGAGNASYGRVGMLSNTNFRDFIIDTGANGTGVRGNIALNPGASGTVSTDGNLTVSGTGLSSVAGALNVTGALLAHQTAALNMAYEGSSISQLVAYGADASTYGRANIILRKAGTGVGAVTALAITSTDATLTGNLTVSGGTLLFNQAAAQYQTFNVNSGGTGDQVEIKYQQVGNGRAGIYFGTAVGGAGYMRVQVGSGGGTTALLANSTGNVLFGTTTDSSNGKIQLATHTTSAGGIGFGTDWTIYRQGANDLNLGTSTASVGIQTAGTLARLLLSGAGEIYTDSNGLIAAGRFGSGQLTLRSIGANSVILQTNSTTALTLDASQNATFAGTVTSNTANASFTAKGSGGLSGYFVSDGNLQDAWGPTAYHLIIKRGKNTATQNRWGVLTVDSEITPDTGAGCNLSFQYAINNGAWTEALKLDRSGNASFAGTIATQGGTASTPANAFATGTAGTIRWDASYIYVCTATNTWKRVAIATW